MKQAYQKTKEDYVYETARISLIPQAEKLAYKEFPKPDKYVTEVIKEKWNNNWNNCFHTTMQSLARKAKLIL